MSGVSQDEQRREGLLARQLFGTPPVTLGRYVIESRLGSGAMGSVYLCRDDRLSRSVAIKVLRSRSTQAVSRLYQEARGLAQVSHHNVVTVHEVAEAGDEVLLVMAYVPGLTLEDWAIDQSRAVRLRACIDAGRGLAAVHAVGLVHRDFKPANVLVGDGNWAYLVDFGLVGHAETFGPMADVADERLTRSGAVMGTPAYMAPEQRAAGETTVHSDQFAYAVTVWELISGALPQDSDASLMGMRAATQVLRRALAVDPSARWPDMNALLDALEATLRAKRRRWWWAAAVLAVGGLVSVQLLGSVAQDERWVAQAQAMAKIEASEAAQILLAVQDESPEWAKAADAVLAEGMSEFVWALPQKVNVVVWAEDALILDQTLQVDNAGVQPVSSERRQALLSEGESLPTGCTHRLGERLQMLGPEGLVELTPEYTLELGPPSPIPVEACCITQAGQVFVRGPSGYLPQRFQNGQWHAVPLAGVHALSCGRHQSVMRAQAALWLVGEGPPAHLGPVNERYNTIALSEDGSLLLAWEDDWLRVWRLDAKALRPPVELVGNWTHHSSSYDGSTRRLALGQKTGDIQVVTLPKNALSPSTIVTLRGHKGQVTGLSFGPDGRLASVSDDLTVRIWRDAGAGETIGHHAGYLWEGTFDAKRTRLATSGFDGMVRIWDLKEHHHRVLDAAKGEYLYRLRFSHSEDRLAVGGSLGKAWVHFLTELRAPLILKGHEEWAYTVDFTVDDSTLITGSKGGVVRRFSSAFSTAGEVVGTHQKSPDSRVHAVCVSDSWIYSAAGNGEVLRWPVAGKSAPVNLHPGAQNSAVHCMPKAQVLVYGMGRDDVTWWQGEAQLGTLKVKQPKALAFHTGDTTQSTLVAVMAFDQTVRIFSGFEQIVAVEGMPGLAEFMAFDSTGEHLAIGLPRGQVRIVRVADGVQTGEMYAPGGSLRFVGFAWDGALVTGSSVGTVRRWAMDPGARRRRLARSACLPPGRRQALLGVSAAQAKRDFEQCIAQKAPLF